MKELAGNKESGTRILWWGEGREGSENVLS